MKMGSLITPRSKTSLKQLIFAKNAFNLTFLGPHLSFTTPKYIYHTSSINLKDFSQQIFLV